MTNITLKGIQLIFSCEQRLTKYQQDALRQEFGKQNVIEVLIIEPVENSQTVIRVLVPASYDLVQNIVERTIIRINQILHVT